MEPKIKLTLGVWINPKAAREALLALTDMEEDRARVEGYSPNEAAEVYLSSLIICGCEDEGVWVELEAPQ